MFSSYSLIVARQRLGRNVPTVAITHEGRGGFFPRLIFYAARVFINFLPDFLVSLLPPFSLQAAAKELLINSSSVRHRRGVDNEHVTSF